ALLQDTGFSQAVAIPGANGSQRAFLPPAAILAKGPAAGPKAELDPPGRDVAKRPGKWLIFADCGEVGKNLAKALSLRGEDCILAFAGDPYKHSEPRSWTLAPGRPADFHRLLQEVVGQQPTNFRGVVHLWGLDAPPSQGMTVRALEESQILGCGSVLHLVQAMAKEGGSKLPRLWLVTRGAQRVGPEATPLGVAQAPLWGLGRVVALEHPAFDCTCVDLDPSEAADEIGVLLEEVWAAQNENQ